MCVYCFTVYFLVPRLSKICKYIVCHCFSVASCRIPDVSAMRYKPSFAPSTGRVTYGDTITVTCTQHLPAPVVTQHTCVYDVQSETYKFIFGERIECPGRYKRVTCSSPIIICIKMTCYHLLRILSDLVIPIKKYFWGCTVPLLSTRLYNPVVLIYQDD